MGPQYLGASGVIVRPAANDTLAQRLCRSQLIRNSVAVQSFSMLGIILILTLGGFIFILSITMESTVGGLQRRLGLGEYRRVQWVMDDKLHLIAMREEEEEERKETTRDEKTRDEKTLQGTDSPSINSVDTGPATTEKKDTSHVALLDPDGTHFA